MRSQAQETGENGLDGIMEKISGTQLLFLLQLLLMMFDSNLYL